MKRFPGTMEMTRGRVHRYVLNDEQKEWLEKWFPTTENKRLAKAMGVTVEKVRDFAKELRLAKSVEGMKAIQRRRAKAAAKTNERNGCYDRKRGKPVSEATMEGQRRRWQEIREGKRLGPMGQLKMRDPKRYKEMIALRTEKRRETMRKETRRMLYGMERKTKLTVVLSPYTQSQTHHRHSALQRGYLVDVDCSEGTPGRYILYYDDQTQRSEKFEANCIKDGFKIMPDL